jgi:O-6-methylguanine DNA methyltransferase
MVHYALLRTAVDPLLAVASPQGLASLIFMPRAWEYHTRAHALARTLETESGSETPDIREDLLFFADLQDQLAEYFIGRRTSFDLELDLRGTDFQIRVWRQLLKIPYGQVRSYGEVARALKQPKATRAVGQAAGHNPLPIIVPCHRVVGQGGSLVGFAGGITTKARLLRLEGHTLGDVSGDSSGDSARLQEPRLF